MIKLGNLNRIEICIFIIIFSVLAVSMTQCIGEILALQKSVGADKYSRYVDQFDSIKNILPTHGIVTYYVDSGFSVKWFYLTQYALAPLFVTRDTDSEFVIGVFSENKSQADYCRWNNASIVKKINDSIVLLRKNK